MLIIQSYSYDCNLSLEARWMNTNTMNIIKHLIGITKHALKTIGIHMRFPTFDISGTKTQKQLKPRKHSALKEGKKSEI